MAPRVLRRVIKAHRGLRAVGLQVPHGDVYALPREALRGVVDADELPAPLDALPERVVLLAAPHRRDLAAGERGELLRRLWRASFHARVHLAIEARVEAGELTAAGAAERIDALGQIPFDEARAVLRADERLLPDGGPCEEYAEVAATWLELARFAPDELPRHFPTFGDRPGVEALFARDVDADALLEATRLPGARAPDAPGEEATPGGAGEGTEATPAEASSGPLRGLVADLARQLPEALEGRGPDEARWREVLTPLLAAGDARRFEVPRRLLHDLRRACAHLDRETYRLALFDWITSLGRRPLRQSLPTDRLAGVVRQLRAAAAKGRRLTLAEPARQRLIGALDQALHAAEENLRGALRPRLQGALESVGLTPASPVEEVARDKLVEELLDRVVATGFLNIGHLRDAISRSDLKLGDLAGPLRLVTGDELLRLDRLLAQRLGGVYRRGEVYMRTLQRVSAVLFGTWPGRLLTRHLVLPLGGAYVLLEGAQHIVLPILRFVGVPIDVRLTTLTSLGVVGALLWALIHAPPFRRGVASALRGLGRALRWVLVTAPVRVYRHPAVQAVLTSAPVQLLRRFLLRPALVAGVLWVAVPLLGRDRDASIISGIALFVATNVLLNSRLGRDVEEVTIDALARAWQRLRYQIVPGLLRWVLETFRTALEQLERVLYRVDDWLRFRRGERRATFLLKLVGTVTWGVVTYVVRLYVNLLVEPQVNPIKHFPVVTVGHKLILPFTVPLTELVATPLVPVFGTVLGTTMAGATVVLLPGVFGFLVWEFKENWKLYSANRVPTLRPIIVGHHSETVLRFMKPGFHSGTLPKAYAKLRRAERALRPGAARRARRTLAEVRHAMKDFTRRELVAALRRCEAWGAVPLEVGAVTLGSNRIRVALHAPTLEAAGAPGPLALAFEEQSGWLVASLAAPGWLATVDDAARGALATALSGFYKRAGVDLVREQLAAVLGPVRAYDVADAGIVAWVGDDYERPVTWRLAGRGPVAPEPHGGAAPLPREAVLFSASPLRYEAWAEGLARGGALGALVPGQRLLPPA